MLSVIERTGKGIHYWRMKIYLRRLREQRGLTQEQLGELALVTPVTVSRLETGAHGWNSGTVRHYARALGVEDYELLGYSHPPDIDLPEMYRDLMKTITLLSPASIQDLQARADTFLRQEVMKRNETVREAEPVRRGRGRPRKYTYVGGKKVEKDES